MMPYTHGLKKNVVAQASLYLHSIPSDINIPKSSFSSL